jgi:tetratricopeptide (TPR) repeat protein
VLNQATGLLQGLRIHHQEFWEAMKVGQQAEERQDYPAAFASFKHAVELDPIDRRAHEQETKAAMLWLETAHGTANRSFTDTANQLLPVLDGSLAKAKGTAAADILAHIGWANFLRYRDGTREGVDVDGSLQRALSIDETNPYAHAISGFWILWQGGNIDSANEHFAAALALGRERAYVRGIQIAALTNRQQEDADKTLLRVASQMRKNGESMSQHDRDSTLFNVFNVRLHDRDELVAMLWVLPPADTEATVNWLAEGTTDIWSEKGDGRRYVVANLREIAGDRAQALFLYRGSAEGNGWTIPVVGSASRRSRETPVG